MPPLRPTAPNYVAPQPPIEEPIIIPSEPAPPAAAKSQIPSLSEIADGVVEFEMGLPAMALDYAIGPTVAQSVKDYGTKALEGSERRGARNRLANRFEAKVRDRVLGRLDILQRQLGDEHHRVLGPAAEPARDGLRGPIQRAQNLQAKLQHTNIALTADVATDLQPLPIAMGIRLGKAAATAAGLIDEQKSLDVNYKTRTELVAEYRALIHKYPAIGAVDLSEVNAHTSDAGLRTLLQSGFEEKQSELHDLRRRVQSRDIPVLQLEHVVNETKAEMGISKEKAAAGDQDSELLLEHLAFESHEQETIDGLLFAGTLSLSLAAFLATGPLAAAGLGAAGIAVGAGSATYNVELADDIQDSAHVGLEDNSQMTDRDAADVRFVMAAAEGVMAVADVGFAAKGLIKSAKATKEVAEAAVQLARHEAVTDVAQVVFKVEVPEQSLHRAYVPSADAPAVQAIAAKVKPKPSQPLTAPAPRPVQPVVRTEPIAQGALHEARGEVLGQGRVVSGNVSWAHGLEQLLIRHDPDAVRVIREGVGERKLAVLAQELEPLEFTRLANDPPQIHRFADTPVQTLKQDVSYWLGDVDRVIEAGPISPFAELQSIPVNQSLLKPASSAKKSVRVGDLMAAGKWKKPA